MNTLGGILILILVFVIGYFVGNKCGRSESDLGGLKEWNTDMPLDADFKLDAEAQRIADEAAKSSACIPIGEGENCW